MSGCVFTSNLSESSGGAVYAAQHDMEIDSSTFIENVAWGSGGGVSLSLDITGEASVNGCSFTSNSAVNGGGMRIEGGDSVVSGSVFEENTAHNVGGGLLLSGTDHSIVRDSTFLENSSTGGGGGLGIGALTYAVGCEFSGNSSAHGGGSHAFSGDGEGVYVGCRFDGNTANVEGGAVSVSTGAEIRMINALVVNNVSPQNTGAVHCAPAGAGEGTESIEIVNSTVANNVGGGVLVGSNPALSQVSNSVVWGNTLGVALIANTPAVSHSLIEGGAPGAGNLDTDPLFVNPVLGNFRLSEGSPAIDMGLNSAVALDDADLDADLITAETVPYDLDGEARMMSVGGCSGVVTVDMGAFEAHGLTEIQLGDHDGNGTVDAGDLAVLLAAWGPCAACCPADYSGDGMVDSTDLAVLLASWD